MGRRVRVLEQDEANRLRLMASGGLSQGEIADRLGITRRGLSKRLATNPLLKAAYDDGVAFARSPEAKKPGPFSRPARARVAAMDPEQARKLIAQGGSLSSVAKGFGISIASLRRRIKESPELEKAIELGKAELIDISLGALARNAKQGDAAAARLLLERLLPPPGDDDAFVRLLKRHGY